MGGSGRPFFVMELKQAVAREYKNPGQMKQDVDIAPLRSREDFQKLLAELGARLVA